MNIPLFRKRDDFKELFDEKSLQNAITKAESNTSGEIKLYIERRNPLVDTVERAGEIFYSLKMEKTAQRNAVLIYMAFKDREFALFGDEGIFQKYPQSEWDQLCEEADELFKKGKLEYGLEYVIEHVGKWLQTQYPHLGACEKNELPDEIVFGQ